MINPVPTTYMLKSGIAKMVVFIERLGVIN